MRQQFARRLGLHADSPCGVLRGRTASGCDCGKTAGRLRAWSDDDEERARHDRSMFSTADRPFAQAASFLRRRRAALVDAACVKLMKRAPRYAAADVTSTHRLEALLDGVVDALEGRDATPLLTYVRTLAGERFRAGYDLSEVQTAFNALEEAIWTDIFTELPPKQYASVLPYVSALLGGAKDALAREYVTLAARTHVPAVDLEALVRGLDGPEVTEAIRASRRASRAAAPTSGIP